MRRMASTTISMFIFVLQVPANGQAHLLLFLEVATAAKHATLERMRGGRLHTTLHVAFTHDVAHFPPEALQEVGNEWSLSLLGATPLPRPPLQQCLPPPHPTLVAQIC